MNRSAVRWSRRRPLRHSVRLACQVVRERDFKLVSRLILDLSEAGALVATPEVVLTGEPVILSFRAPFSPDFVDVEATVVRVVHGRRGGDLGRGLGLCFDALDPAWRELLRTQLRGFPPPLPGRDSHHYAAGNQVPRPG
jgi:hypothetical protein